MSTKLLTESKTRKQRPHHGDRRSFKPNSTLPAPSLQPHATAGRHLRVLVVDDQKDLSDSLNMLLKTWGYESEVAYDGEGAIAMAAHFDPDVIILDIGLPRIDGCEVARRLTDDHGIHSALIVALTAYVGECQRLEIMKAGFDLYLAKPVDPEVIHHLLEWLERELPENVRPVKP